MNFCKHIIFVLWPRCECERVYSNLCTLSALGRLKLATYRLATLSSSLHLVPNDVTSWAKLRTCSSCFLLIRTKSLFSIRRALVSVFASRAPHSGDFVAFAKPDEAGTSGEMWPFIPEPCGERGGEKLSSEAREYAGSLEESASSDAAKFTSGGTWFSCRSGWSSWACSGVWKYHDNKVFDVIIYNRNDVSKTYNWTTRNGLLRHSRPHRKPRLTTGILIDNTLTEFDREI